MQLALGSQGHTGALDGPRGGEGWLVSSPLGALGLVVHERPLCVFYGGLQG
jgi:hypothetical protein